MKFKNLVSNLVLDETTLTNFFNSIFFPRKLPSRVQDVEKDENIYIMLMIESILKFSKLLTPNTTDLTKVFEVLKSWHSLQNSEFIDNQKLHNQLINFKAESQLILYLRGQNASICIKNGQTSNDPILITAFQPSASNSEFMPNPNDLCNSYPTYCFSLSNKDLIKEKVFSTYLANLANFSNDLSKAVSVKKGSETEEFRDCFSPALIYEWFLSFCCSKPADGFIQVVKKYRDHVVSDLKGLPFRRSGMWTTVKAFTNVLLVEEFGDLKGKAVYKVLVMFCHLIIAKKIKVEFENGFEIMQKMAKRLKKLERFKDGMRDVVEKVDGIVQGYVKQVKNQIDELFYTNVVPHSRSCKAILDPRKISINDKYHNLSDLLKKIESNSIPENQKKEITKCKRLYLRLKLGSGIPDKSIFNNSNIDSIILQDFESWVRYTLNPDIYDYTEDHNKRIISLFVAYIKAAKNLYKGDPLGYSRMVLTAYKMIYTIDRITCKEHPIVQQHKLGISTELFKYFLLPRKSDIEYAQNLFNYFTDRDKAQYPDLLEPPKNNKNLFGLRYSKMSRQCKDLKKILEDIENVNIEEKENEVIEAVEKYNNMITKINSMSCDYSDDYYFSSHDRKRCTRCYKTRVANRIKVDVYEKLIPESSNEKDLVIFELLIPTNISILRDTIYLFHKHILLEKVEGTSIKGKWLTHLSSYKLSSSYKSKISLGSTSQSFLSTHYKFLQVRNNSNEYSYVKPNGFDLHYSTNKKSLVFKSSFNNLKDLFTFKAEENYKTLQWVLSSACYLENQAIAEQGKCPNDMTKKEYLKFSMFRAGLNLQLYNLLDAVETRTLPFKNNSVYYLICQSLWELGPVEETKSTSLKVPVVHELMNNENYLNQLYVSVSDLLDTCIHNWNEHIVLLNVVTICLRVISLTACQLQREKFVDLLINARKINMNWQEKIEDMLTKTDNMYEKEKISSKGKLLEICCICVLTYFIDRHFSQLVLNNDEDVSSLFMSLSKIYDHKVLYGDSKSPLRTNMLIWVNLTMNELEPHLLSYITKNPKSISKFLNKKWPDSLKGNISQNFEYNAEKYCLICKFTSTTFTTKEIKIGLDGAFLIDNQPVSKLPKEICSHQLFQRLFKQTDFDIHPSSTSTSGLSTKWVIVNDKLKLSYTFTYLKVSKDKEILQIKETRYEKVLNSEAVEQEVRTELELVPYYFFKGLLPKAFVDDCSHWIDRSKGWILFRKKGFDDNEFFCDESYVMDLAQRVVLEKGSRRQLISVASSSFKEFCDKIAFRMENSEAVHMFADPGDSLKITVDLPRYGLSFEISEDRSQVLSKEFRGLKINEDQSLGTLLNIEQGLILSTLSSSPFLSKQKLIIPHSSISLLPSYPHHQTQVHFDSLRSPSFFIYDIDSRCQQLRAGESISAWLYLSYLHAVSSSVLPDPFLGVPGTTRALEILQSPHTFACTPLDKESYKTLLNISKLSPERLYVPSHLKLVEKVVWPKLLSSYCAHDGFLYLAHGIVENSNRLGFLHERREINEQIKLNDNGKVLYVKAYVRMNPVWFKLMDEFEGVFVQEDEVKQELKAYGLCADWNLESVIRVKRVERLEVECKAAAVLKFKEMEELVGRRNCEIQTSVVTDWICIAANFVNYWLDLYEICRNCDGEKKLEILVGLSFLAYIKADRNQLNNSNIDLDLVYLLVLILKHQSYFKEHPAPNYPDYQDISENNFDSDTIKELIKSKMIPVETYHMRNPRGFNLLQMREIGAKYLIEVEEATSLVLKHYKSQWPSHKTSAIKCSLVSESDLNHNVSNIFYKWFQNYEFCNFIDSLQKIFSSLPAVKKSPIEQFIIKKLSSSQFNHNLQYIELKETPAELAPMIETAKKIFKTGRLEEGKDFVEISENNNEFIDAPEFPFSSGRNSNLEDYLINDLKNSWNEHHLMKSCLRKVNRVEDIENELKIMNGVFKDKLRGLRDCIDKIVFCDGYSLMLRQAMVFPEVTPSDVQKILISKGNKYFRVSEDVVFLCGAICVVWTLQQRVERCLLYLDAGDTQSLALTRELENLPYENWSPQEYPSWLVLQIELDMMIRPIQVEVAKAMMNPENNKSLVTQLNMGEGKTSLILPMIALVLANGKCLLRITVLKSLFNMNKSALIQKLGGVLNKRVYVLPCRRDKRFDEKNIEIIDEVLKECLYKKGILISLPEYRLSFILKGLELSRGGKDQKLAKKMIEIERWLKEKGRDILDESDEILSPKYQLIYTIGQQSQVCCGNLRWQVSQAVLDLAKNHFFYIQEKYGETIVSLEVQTNKLAYPHFRLLKREAYDELCERICLDILKGKAKQIKFFELKKLEIEIVSEYILKKEVSSECRTNLSQIITDNSENYQIITILRGIFAYEILLTVLYKRWRVNYGVNTKSKYLMQAVPFRAKDVPADRAQFAHPDIAILLTQLSYFYSGLDNSQLDDVFKKLYLETDPDSEYESWIKSIPEEIEVHKSIKTLKGINLSETHQKYNILFETLRMHIPVINYWLNTYVYPKEAKEFSGKLGNSAWDLCPEETITTGFSGTNDSRLLLPLTTDYFGIAKLSGTNGSLIESLLLPENNDYYHLKSGISSIDILKTISSTSPSLKLLLDVGALMLELSNQSLVQEWLKLRPDLEAGVFFDDNNDLRIVDKKGNVVSFEMSPYKNHLENCVIYLDDSHTRGTDLKIPKGTVGAVTLGKGLTKDRLMQACMRMRMLGKGHNVCFFACYEVDFTIRQKTQDIGAREVLEWVIGNTRDMIIEQFMYWAVQGISYYRRLQVYQMYLQTGDASQYSKLYEDKDLTDIKNLYSYDRIEKFVCDILKSRVDHITNSLNQSIRNSRSFKTFTEKIMQKIGNYLENQKVYSHLFDEEQELELEIEKEEERQKEIPKSAVPLNPSISIDLELYIKTGCVPQNSRGFIPIGLSLLESSIKPLMQPEAWSKRIFVTYDYLKTVKSVHCGDDYLRPPRWICYNESIPDAELVIISAHEADQLMSKFNQQGTALAMFIPRTRIDQIICFNKFQLKIPQNILAQLAVYAGSMFLQNEEIEFYLKFIGYCPSPRNEVEEKMFNDGLILHCGFVKDENRMKVFGNRGCLFKDNPDKLVMKIAEVRNYGIVSKFAHYFEIFQSGRRPF